MRRSGLQHLPFTPRRAPALRSERVLERKTTTYAGGAQQFGKSRRACARRGANTTHRTLMLFYNTNPRPLAISPWTALRLSQRRQVLFTRETCSGLSNVRATEQPTCFLNGGRPLRIDQTKACL